MGTLYTWLLSALRWRPASVAWVALDMQTWFCFVVLVFATTTLAAVPPAGADNGAREYRFQVCDAFLDGIVGFDARCVARASNGDVFETDGRGTLAIHPKSASGGGVFEHRMSDGTVVGGGTWRVVDLLSFTSYGSADPSSGIPPQFEGGQALLKVILSPQGAPPGMELEATLQVHCILPGAQNPPGAQEGIRLNARGINFNQEVDEAGIHPATVFEQTG